MALTRDRYMTRALLVLTFGWIGGAFATRGPHDWAGFAAVGVTALAARWDWQRSTR